MLTSSLTLNACLLIALFFLYLHLRKVERERDEYRNRLLWRNGDAPIALKGQSLEDAVDGIRIPSQSVKADKPMSKREAAKVLTMQRAEEREAG